MSTNSPNYWFRAKRYGWGWGLPSSWQGWVVLAAYFALALGGIPLVYDLKGTVVYITYVVILTVVFLAICWLTGEPLHWRWGEDGD